MHAFFALKSIPHVKYEKKKKKVLVMPVSLPFSQHWTYFGPDFAPRPHSL